MPPVKVARHNVALLILLLAVQLLMGSAGARRPGESLAESWVMRVSSPVVALGKSLTGVVRAGTTGVRDLIAAHHNNARLEAELSRLSSELVRCREASNENGRLRRLLAMREALVPGSIAASVVTSNLDGQTRMMIVDRGSSDGVRPDLPVVAWGGAVGKVIATGSAYAKVQLLTDANSGVAAVVQRSRAQGIAVGRAEAALDLVYVPLYSDVMHGDRVVTSGLDGVFPVGFGIGRVSAISEEPGAAQTIRLEPELDYGSVEEVLILLQADVTSLLDPGATPEVEP